MGNQDKSFIFRFQVVLGILVAASVVFFIIARVIETQSGDETSGEGMFAQAIEQRIAPVGQVNIQGQAHTEPAAASAAKAPAAPAQVSKAATAPAVPTNFKDIQAMMQKAGCFACHAVDHKIVGPSYQDVAKRYKGQKGVVAMLAEKVIKGGAGHWNAITGGVPMPPHPNLTKSQAEAMVKWVLAQ